MGNFVLPFSLVGSDRELGMSNVADNGGMGMSSATMAKFLRERMTVEDVERMNMPAGNAVGCFVLSVILFICFIYKTISSVNQSYDNYYCINCF